MILLKFKGTAQVIISDTPMKVLYAHVTKVPKKVEM